MGSESEACDPPKTHAGKLWEYHQYYFGKRDEEERKNGFGENRWTGAESLEAFTGCMYRDTMHGYGDYRWRHRGPENLYVTFEGHFFNNCMHGYGTMSYTDGRTYTGLFYNDFRYGPGVEYFPTVRANVGLWRGTQLIRLAWSPPTVSVTPDFLYNGNSFVTPHRVILKKVTKTIGVVNSALELLKKWGSNPVSATENWSRIYPKHCTDLKSRLCNVDGFDQDYYKGAIHMLEEMKSLPENETQTHLQDTDVVEEDTYYYAWNNNHVMIHMMKHCFKQDKQKKASLINLAEILVGPRNDFKPAAKHELDCRTLLMACYLGHVINVAQLINECGVNPDISDSQGNSAIMYATTGDRTDVIHFLVKAGANINSYNDACCTPLGVALLRFACTQLDVPQHVVVQASLPKDAPVIVQDKVSEWEITRELPDIFMLRKATSKIVKGGVPRTASIKKMKSSMSLRDLSKKKAEITPQKSAELSYNDSADLFCEESRLYHIILNEYIIRVNDALTLPNPVSPIPYIFEVNEMECNIGEEESKKPEKISKKVLSKVIKDTIKPSKDKMWQNGDKENASTNSIGNQKMETLSQMMATIKQLLKDGADPRLVRFPQPALYMATVSMSSELVSLLVKYGADVNEIYPQALNYSALDIAVSGPLTNDNLDLIQSLLEGGACVDHRLTVTADIDADPAIPGPTLLHAVLAKKTENTLEEDVHQQIIELLLEYGCNPMTQYKGHSALEMAMTKNIEIFDVFIKSPRTNLNEVINMTNQNVLAKMFSLAYCRTIQNTERLQMLTNLLLYGADPLLECQNGDQVFQNLFVYAKKEMESIPTKSSVTTGASKPDAKAKKAAEKPVISTKSAGKIGVDDKGDYKQALDLVIECARLLHVRWLQAKLMKELIKVVYTYKHRHWVMILKEIQNKKPIGLWLTAERCLEIWDILSTTKNKKYSDKIVLRHVLCITDFYFRNNDKVLRYAEKDLKAKDMHAIEAEIDSLVREHSVASSRPSDMVLTWKLPYVKPELTAKRDEAKFKVCFECAMPLEENRILCGSCKLVSYCSFECIKSNIEQVNCHPCSKYLQEKYFSEDNLDELL